MSGWGGVPGGAGTPARVGAPAARGTGPRAGRSLCRLRLLRVEMGMHEGHRAGLWSLVPLFFGEADFHADVEMLEIAVDQTIPMKV